MSTEAHEPASPNCGDLASYWKAAHDLVVAQNWELSRQIDALQKVGEQCLRPQQTPTGEGERIRGGELELLIAAQAARKAALAHPQQGGERDEAPVWGTAALLRAASINLRWAEDGYSVVLRCKGLDETKKLHDGLKAFAETAPTSPSKSSGEEA